MRRGVDAFCEPGDNRLAQTKGEQIGKRRRLRRRRSASDNRYAAMRQSPANLQLQVKLTASFFRPYGFDRL
jgi:hypothetical protein